MSLLNRRKFISSAVMSVSAIAVNKNFAEEKDFSNKIIEIIIPFKEGGGADVWGRFNASFLSRYLPGNPIIIVRNIPGGNSITGANRYARNVKPDGLLLLGTSASTQFPYLLKDPRVNYDYVNWRPIMTYGTGGVVYISPKLGINNLEELSNITNTQLFFGSQGPTSLDLVPVLGFKLLNLNVKPIFGFSGRGAGRLAFERGETHIDYQTSSAYLRNVMPLVQNGDAIPLFSWGVLDHNNKLIRDPTFPDLPHFGEAFKVIHNKTPEGLAWDAWFSFFSAGFPAQKLLVVPRETPENIIYTYTLAIEAMKQDPEYIERKIIALGNYEQSIGKSAQAVYKLSTQVSTRAIDWVRGWLNTEFGINLEV